jgi:hypothetical protein
LTITLFPYYLPKMPSSPPEPPPADANTSDKGTSTGGAVMGAWAIALTVILGLWYFLWNLGAASLSYAKYGSVGWAILDFFFAPLYYPYYALVLNTPTPTMMGGRRRTKLW